MEDEAHCSAYSFVDVEELKIGRCYVAPLPLQPEREMEGEQHFPLPDFASRSHPSPRAERGPAKNFFRPCRSQLGDCSLLKLCRLP